MKQDHDSRTLRRVFSRSKPESWGSRLFFSDEAGPQGSLFPRLKPGVVVFGQLAGVDGDEFAEVLRQAQPSHVFDLRIAPYFDVRNLNRQTAFALFDEINTTYVDTTIPLMRGEQRELAVQRLRDTVVKVDAQRPLVFLFASEKSSMVSNDEVLNMLRLAGKPASEFFYLPGPEASGPLQPV